MAVSFFGNSFGRKTKVSMDGLPSSPSGIAGCHIWTNTLRSTQQWSQRYSRGEAQRGHPLFFSFERFPQWVSFQCIPFQAYNLYESQIALKPEVMLCKIQTDSMGSICMWGGTDGMLKRMRCVIAVMLQLDAIFNREAILGTTVRPHIFVCKTEY